MKETNHKDRIVTIDERHHVINGILVDLSPGIYNLDDPEDRKKLISEAEHFRKERKTVHCEWDLLSLTKISLTPEEQKKYGREFGIGTQGGHAEAYIEDFAEKIDRSLAERIQKALDEYRNKAGDNVQKL